MSATGSGERGQFDGVRMILRYNWPLYLAGLATTATGAVLAASRHRDPGLRSVGGAAALGAGWLSVASLAASWWVYDRSELYRWTWLDRAVPRVPERVLVAHAGLDEASQPVRRVWPAAHVEPVDVHGGTGPMTGSLQRARTGGAPVPGGGWDDEAPFDVAVAFLAAHEIRTADGRDGLFADIRSRLRPGGRLVLVEHVRDLVNALAYGPAVGHFYPVREWRRVIRAAGFEPIREERITPFLVLLTADGPR